jgi:hypothetical protein
VGGAFVAAHAGQRAAKVDGFVVDLGDRIGVLRPIAEQPMCASCHGALDQLAPGVDLVRRQRYPARSRRGLPRRRNPRVVLGRDCQAAVGPSEGIGLRYPE